MYSSASGHLGYYLHAVDFDVHPPSPLLGDGVVEDIKTTEPAGDRIKVLLRNGQTIAPVPSSRQKPDAQGCADLLTGPTATGGGDDAKPITVGKGSRLCFRTHEGRVVLLEVVSVHTTKSLDWNENNLGYRATVWDDSKAPAPQ
ncbi:hypothetical protein [Streptomyces sp. NPDC057689]|uniref:hypothetical protein n=1 Tax=Streptomyces sp. NPDC057689 TaxID=3346213 RepID=UPI0036B70D0F